MRPVGHATTAIAPTAHSETKSLSILHQCLRPPALVGQAALPAVEPHFWVLELSLLALRIGKGSLPAVYPRDLVRKDLLRRVKLRNLAGKARLPAAKPPIPVGKTRLPAVKPQVLVGEEVVLVGKEVVLVGKEAVLAESELRSSCRLGTRG